MFNEKSGFYSSLEDYRAAETEFHMELMAVSRKYIHKLSIVSLIGVLDVVKEEVKELQKATNKNLDAEPDPLQPPQHHQPNMEVKEPGFFNLFFSLFYFFSLVQ